MGEYGISEEANGKAVPRAQKHALITRECRCGRKIAGNVYFRHLRHCNLNRKTTRTSANTPVCGMVGLHV